MRFIKVLDLFPPKFLNRGNVSFGIGLLIWASCLYILVWWINYMESVDWDSSGGSSFATILFWVVYLTVFTLISLVGLMLGYSYFKKNKGPKKLSNLGFWGVLLSSGFLIFASVNFLWMGYVFLEDLSH